MIKRVRTLALSFALAMSLLPFASTTAQAAADEKIATQPSAAAGARMAAQPSAAAAGGSFSYEFKGTCCINTRQFTTVTENDVWFDIDSISPCDNWPGSTYGAPKVEITLYQSDAFADTKIGAVKTISGCAGDVKWVDVNARKNLYFNIKILYPHRDSKTYTIKGTAAYDGRTT